MQHRNFVSPIILDDDSVQTFYLQIYTGSSVQIPLIIWSYAAFHTKSLTEYSIFGTLFGLSVVMALYNLYLYFSIRDMSYLYYVLFVLLNTFLFLTDTGLIYHYLWPEQHTENLISVTELMYLSNIAGLLFVQSFLPLNKRVNRMDFIFNVLIALGVIAFIIRQFTVTGSVYIAAILVFLSIFAILFASGRSLREGYRPARYLLIAWGFFLLGVLISLMVDIGIIPLTIITKYAWQITTFFEVVLLSISFR